MCCCLVRARVLLSCAQAWEKDAKQQVDKDVEFAKGSPFPPLSDMWEDIYQGAPPPFIRAVEYGKSISAKA
jgi:TPP-dependent pyruvate/acetoin dehydrogenase alpha subunit